MLALHLQCQNILRNNEYHNLGAAFAVPKYFEYHVRNIVILWLLLTSPIKQKKLHFCNNVFFCGEKPFKISILSLKKIILQLCCQYSRK